MRLPRRLVKELADVVHSKTSGENALFVVQLLNSLVREATVAYSPRELRYDYDRNILISVKTWTSVAGLIVSNLSSLSNVDLQNLRILCCFGMESHRSILRLIDGCPGVQSGGMSSYISRLVNDGILERVGPLIRFSHDLIHMSKYTKT